VQETRTAKASNELAGLKGLLAELDFTILTDHQIGMMLELAGLGGGDLPSEDGEELNEILDLLPSEVTDRLLTIYYNRLSRYRPSETASEPGGREATARQAPVEAILLGGPSAQGAVAQDQT